MRRTLLFAAAVLVLNLAGAYLLDALGLIEALLSPHAGTTALLIPLAALFYTARILSLFVVPGLFTGSLLLHLLDRRYGHRTTQDERARGGRMRGGDERSV